MRFENYYNGLKILDFPELRQVYSYDCGANAMQSIVIYYGDDVREQEIMKIAGTTKDGTPPSGLKKVAEKYKIPFKDGKFTINDLKTHIDNKWPTLIPIQAYPENPEDVVYEDDWEDGHWVIVIGYTKTGIVFEDPSSTKRTFIDYVDLDKRWHDEDNDKNRLDHYGIVFTGIPNYRSNDIIKMESKRW